MEKQFIITLGYLIPRKKHMPHILPKKLRFTEKGSFLGEVSREGRGLILNRCKKRNS